ncbi:MAG: hypothetical protein IRZ31_05950 [Thermogemmatispora sp.]|uniref:hypothetical protein n=1 Tax=Thermogemmatispora sp. TaxID=1968838 RepID=UPI0026075B18|nr:hypothetical protein [Thermogemmatispora sp.]MBX5456426.1 hypothetical protein [Thermogemmatispora sp.]
MATEENQPLSTNDIDQPAEEAASSGIGQGPVASASGSVAVRPWYRLLNEDWWALILGLVLIILIVTRILHSIP